MVIKKATEEQAIEAIKKRYGDVQIYTHYYKSDDLTLYFIEPPDKYFQNYIGQRGRAAFVLSE